MKEELLGLSVLQEEYLKCGDCNTPLVDIIVTETNETRRKRGEGNVKVKFHAYNCYKCGGQSFDSPVYEGTIIVGPPNDDVNIDTIDVQDVGNGILLSKIVTEAK